MSTESAERMMTLFDGYQSCHGTHGMPEREPSGKWTIKRTAKTINGPPTKKLWQQHIAGKRPLGVVPICDDATCVWGSIDIDKYHIDHLEVIQRVEAMKLPLVPCRSKSGGLHLFMFARARVSASAMRETLRNLAASLGFAESEIFPKQTHIEQGDSGSWMVMPYYGDTFGDRLQFQHGLKKTGAEMTLAEFLSFAEKSKVTEEQMAQFREKPSTSPRTKRHSPSRDYDPSADLGDGPPCLQTLAAAGFPEGGRNNALLHLGVYLKKAFPANWKQQLAEDNQKYMRPPLPAEEVVQVQKQLEKKDYEYLCKHEPMSGHCDASTCVTRVFGVGDGTGVAVITSMRKVNSEEPIWYLTIKGSNRGMTISDARDIHIHQRFVTQCVKQLNMSFPPVSAAVWSKFVNAAFAIMTEEQASEDTTRAGQFRELLETFLTNRQRGSKKEDLLRGVPWEDEQEGQYYFNLTALMKFLEREGMRASRNEVTEWIRQLGGPDHSKETTVKGKSVRLWCVPSSAVQETPEISPPELPRDQI